MIAVAELAAKACKESYKSFKAAQSGPKELENLAGELRGLCQVLAALEGLLKKNHAQNDQVLDDMYANIEIALKDCLKVYIDVKSTIATDLDTYGSPEMLNSKAISGVHSKRMTLWSCNKH